MDFDSLAQAGSIMGSGGMIVMDDQDCVVDVARYFLHFLQEESCGKCLPCRLGLKGMLEFLDRFAKGQGAPEDIDALESLGAGPRGRVFVRSGGHRAQSGAHQHPLFQGRIPGPHRGPQMPGRECAGT